MVVLKVLLYVVEIVVCLLLALVVMLQKPKEGGLGGAISGGAIEASLGADAGNVLIRATAILGAIFLVTTLAIARVTSSSQSVIADKPAVTQEAPAEGAAEAAPAPEGGEQPQA